KLCGYLQKLSGKGPLRGFRSRWFVFDPRRCYLYYFKGPQEALPLGRIDIASACFSYHQPEAGAAAAGDEGAAFEVHSPNGAVAVLKAATRQDMTYWLQELQQKRWEYCNNLDAAKRDSRTSPTPSDFSKGLVAKDNPGSILSQNASAERARNILAVETSPTDLVGEQAASQPAPVQPSAINFSLKQWSTEIKNSMSSLRKGNNENRKSIFYTTEEWELLDPTPKDLEDSMALEEKRKHLAEGSKGRRLTSSAFPFDFGRIPHKTRRPLKDMIGSSKNRNSSDSSPTEWYSGNGNKLVSELQLKYQSQQEELEKLKKDLLSQKVIKPSDKMHKSKQIWQAYLYDFPSLCKLPDTLLNSQVLRNSVKPIPISVLVFLISVRELLKKKKKFPVSLMSIANASRVELAFPRFHSVKPLTKHGKQQSVVQSKFLKTSNIIYCFLQYTSLEAKLCQIESKYLILLQEMKTPVCSEEQSPASEVITQLLEDALKAETSEQPEQAFFKPHLVSEYDIYGFQTVPEDDDEEKLVAKSRALDLRSLSLSENREISTGVKWENYLASTMNREMMRCVELKNLIRSGIPHEHRSKMWKWCVNLHVKKFKDSTVPGYFQTLLQNALEKQNPASKQIELDLLRTLPNNKHYSSPTSEGIQKLRNVLLAFSWRNPDIGYCQGLNRLVAIALLYLEQEDAFWCLVTIVEVFMPRDYYTKTLLGSQVDQRVFKDLMSEKLPRLHAHFEQYKVDYTLITFNWFLVVFVDSVVSDILFKIWDSFLYEGPKVIFRFALALFKYKEEEILKLQDSMSIFKYLRYFTRTILDARKLTGIAFGDLNPFPLRQIRNRRTYHLEKVRLELTELEAIREDFLRERETCVEKRDLISDDEEDS
ncbi:TBD2B protein, partial [Circaetus pectoralis]|nr:TBD2B protein [Circaetus pectoralis]